jgi:hypothetical protein
LEAEGAKRSDRGLEANTMRVEAKRRVVDFEAQIARGELA